MSGSESTQKSAKSEQTKKKIITIYLGLIDEKKWDKISVKELCAHAEITRGTFYQYYSDIYDLMEHIETTLLDDIIRRYTHAARKIRPASSMDHFLDDFDYAPPETFNVWFDFCKQYKNEMRVLLNPKNGDTYFVNKLKKILGRHLNQMMDDDMLPHDELRNHFVKLLIEMHFLAARSWLDSSADDLLSTKEILNLLNTTRVGAAYLQYQQHADADFEARMELTKTYESTIPSHNC